MRPALALPDWPDAATRPPLSRHKVPGFSMSNRIMHRFCRVDCLAGQAALAAAMLCVWATAGAAEPTFERDVRPILKTYCLDCHGGGETLSGNLDLRLARFAKKGGDSGPAIVAGDAAGSLIVERIK